MLDYSKLWVKIRYQSEELIFGEELVSHVRVVYH